MLKQYAYFYEEIKKDMVQIINGDLVVMSIYNQASASDSVTQIYRLKYI